MNQTKTENTKTENRHVEVLDLRLFDIGAEAADGSHVETKTPEVGFKDRRKGAAERERMARAALHGTGDVSAKAVENPQNTTASHKETEASANFDRKGEDPTKFVERVENSANSHTETARSGGEARLDELMKDPDFRRAFSDRAQSMIDKRFKEYKGLQAKYEALSPIIEALSEKYGTAKGDVGALVQAFGADSENSASFDSNAEISTEDRKNRENTADPIEEAARRRSREAARRINAEAFALGELYSDFDLKRSLADPKIREMLKSGVSLRAAYEAANIDKILKQRTAAAEQRVLENIKARNGRPIEGGANAQSGAVAQNLSPRLTRQDRERLAQRAIRGEKISL